MPWRFLRMEEHFELIKANFIRCEECNENFFFDFLRHPRYFVTHFKACHLKNLLYRFNGYSEEENSKTRFGPRRKRDANAWFGQLKSTEKRMISMQDNKWSEITENECWSCRLCNDGKADLTHVFELNELGRGQAFLHLRQFHEAAYEGFLQSLPDVQNAAMISIREGDVVEPPSTSAGAHRPPLPVSSRTLQQRVAEAERSRLRRLRATTEEKKTEAMRSKKRRESLTPVQRQADYDRRKRKKKRVEESVRSKKRREDASQATKEKEVMRSRERRRNATEEQRQREALRSRMRRQNATEEQKFKERERCRKRYEAKKAGKQSSSGQGSDDGGDSGHFSDVSTDTSMYRSLAHDANVPSVVGGAPLARYGMPAANSHHMAPPMDMMNQQLLSNHHQFHSGMPMELATHSTVPMAPESVLGGASVAHGAALPARSTIVVAPYQIHPMAMYNHVSTDPKPSSSRVMHGAPFQPPPPTMMSNGPADNATGYGMNHALQPLPIHQDHPAHPFFFENDSALMGGSPYAPLSLSNGPGSTHSGGSTAV